MSKKFVVISLLFFILTAQAKDPVKDPVDDLDILAQRGNGVVTQAAFAARADEIPADKRRAALRDGNRVRDLVNTLLLRSQLASDARDAGFDKEQIVIERLQLALEAELSEAWLQHYVAIQPAGDYEALAHEYFLLHRKEIMSSPKINVSHILISKENRSDQEAQMLADSISQQLKENSELFDELVLAHSEDPSARSNNGKFTNVKKGDMVKPFEETAFALEPGEISDPVMTTYGYHIIRLDARIEPKQLDFDSVKGLLIENERKKHEERVKQEYLQRLTSQEVKMTQVALEKMVKTQFGEDYVEPQVETQEPD